MPLPLYVVDAFASAPFGGNPAAVCPLPRWLEPALMQAIAAENNLSETAFLVGRGDGDFELRWFTPKSEVELCGHATLAAGFVLLRLLEPQRRSVRFHSLSGPLEVALDGERLALELPAREPLAVEPPAALREALGARALEWHRGQYPLAVLESEAAVRALAPDVTRFDTLSVTARGETCDFVSRFFAPGYGIAEDPVTGSAHCTLVPYWSRRLGKRVLQARQLSARGGELECEARGERVVLRGRCALYARGGIEVDA